MKRLFIIVAASGLLAMSCTFSPAPAGPVGVVGPVDQEAAVIASPVAEAPAAPAPAAALATEVVDANAASNFLLAPLAATATVKPPEPVKTTETPKTTTKAPEPVRTEPPKTEPAKPAVTVKEPLALDILSLTTPVKNGDSVTLRAHTVAGATCNISVYYSTVKSGLDALNQKIAEASGNVSWTWKIGGDLPAGTYRIEVTSKMGDRSASQTTYLTVNKADTTAK